MCSNTIPPCMLVYVGIGYFLSLNVCWFHISMYASKLVNRVTSNDTNFELQQKCWCRKIHRNIADFIDSVSTLKSSRSGNLADLGVALQGLCQKSKWILLKWHLIWQWKYWHQWHNKMEYYLSLTLAEFIIGSKGFLEVASDASLQKHYQLHRSESSILLIPFRAFQR